MLKWAELAVINERPRFEALSRALSDAGFANEVSFLTTELDRFSEHLSSVKQAFDQLRISGPLCEVLPGLMDHAPATVIEVKTADALVQSDDSEGTGQAVRTTDQASAEQRLRNSWWPRICALEGLKRAFVSDMRGRLDLSGAVLVVGANHETRLLVAALSRIGFARFSITDRDDSRAEKMVDELNKLYFGVRFQFVPTQMITQLPSSHSVGILTLDASRDRTIAGELLYFNFLKPGGVWADLSFLKNSRLDSEASGVGALVHGGARFAAWTDVVWANEILGVHLEIDLLATQYENLAKELSGSFS